METIVVAISGIITVIITQYFLLVRQKLFLNKKFDKQDKVADDINEKLETIDVKQNERIEALENKNIDADKILKELHFIKMDISYLKDLHKYTYLLKELETKIGKTADNILILKEFKNKEIKEALKFGQKKSLEIFDLILNKDFDINEKKLQEEILLALKTIKISIDCKKLCLKEPEKFMLELENKLRIITDVFIMDFAEVSKMINGERRKMFESICLQMIKNIYNQSIDLYKGYE
jgi:hypothetical protein